MYICGADKMTIKSGIKNGYKIWSRPLIADKGHLWLKHNETRLMVIFFYLILMIYISGYAAHAELETQVQNI